MDQPRTLDYTPAGVLAGGGNPVAGLEAATATLRALYKPGSQKAEVAGLHVVSSFDDALRDAVERSAPIGVRAAAGPVSERDHAWWVRWLAGVRDAWMAVCDGYWCLSPSNSVAGSEAIRLRLASSVVEALKWSACDRFGPEEVLWGRIGQLFASSPEARDSIVGGDVHSLGREYLRAVAHYSINLDQVELEMGVALGHVVDICLPFLSLDRRAADVPQYVVVPEEGTIPVRQMGKHRDGEWRFAPWAACELLAEFSRQLARSIVPAPFGRLPLEHARAAVEYLRMQWSHTPPVRTRRRYLQDASADIARGLHACTAVIGGQPLPVPRNWKVVDFSRSGLQIVASSDPTRAWPDIGELLGIHFSDGQGWQLGIVRRLRMWATHAGLGIELLARSPSLGVLDDGRSSVDGILCDVPSKGEALRVLMPANAPALGEPVFVKMSGTVCKLRSLGVLRREAGYQLQVFQVL
ncbi:MAG: hypothetical protein JNL37_13965 [Thauera sp.]|nr:hypothetical protein [Thauera sp.]